MEKFYSIGEFSRLTNIKVKTLQKWDRDGILLASLVRLKPRFITIETLDIKDLLENDSSHKLHKYIQDSKLCSYCGHKK